MNEASWGFLLVKGFSAAATSEPTSIWSSLVPGGCDEELSDHVRASLSSGTVLSRRPKGGRQPKHMHFQRQASLQHHVCI